MAASDDRPVSDEVKRVFSDPGALAEQLQRQYERTESTAEGGEGPGDQDPVLASAHEERQRVLADGIEGLTKVAEGREQDVTPQEEFGMEAIVLLEGRPAILIQQGDFLQPPSEWSHLTDERADVRDVIARVGRVEVDGHLDLDWIGTGFLVGESTLMTNRHVAVEFSRRDGADGWTFKQGMQSRLDFREELGSTTPLEFEITGVIGVHEDHDLALLRIGDSSRGGDSLPTPLEVAGSEPDDLVDREVYVVGYPAWDGRRNEPEPMRRIFIDIFNVKRLQPGKAVAFAPERAAVQHDCSTLGGNSGSPVVDLQTHRVIGLHFGGRYGVGNYAVPLWTLTGDALIEAGKLNFV